MLIAASCTKDVTNTLYAEEGGVSISAAINNTLSSRAIDSETLLNTANVKIYMPNYAGLAREYTYSDMPDVVYLPAGTGYRVDVVAGEHVNTSPAIASFENKSYKGSASFDVTAGVVNASPITVNAKICNAITNATLDSSIDEAFEDGYKLTIGLDGNNLEYTAANSGSDGYFIIADNALSPKLAWSFSGTLTKNGEAFTKSGEFEVAQGKKYTMNLIYIEKEGILTVNILVDKSTDNYNDQITFEPTSSGISSSRKYEFWATHATVHADVDLATYDESKVFFQYRKSGEEAWTMSDAATKVSEDGAFDAVLSGLTPETTYEYQLVVTDLNSNTEEVVPGIKTFTTDSATDVENGGFEDTCTENGLPAFFPAGGTKWWCCGNQATKDYVNIIGQKGVITFSDTDVPGNENLEGSSKSVKMVSQELDIIGIKKFAAGNIFYGQYNKTIGTSGGSVYFGRPFTDRPVGLRCWIKYVGGQITHTGEGSPITKGEYDIAQLKVALGIWDPATYGGNATSPVEVNTTDTSTFIDYAADAYDPKDPDNSGRTLAYGDLQITSAATGADYVEYINGATQKRDYTSWQEVIIPLEYYDETTMPTHLIISAAGSKYGDYLSGCNGGTMWLDGVELIYDLNELK